MGLFKRLNFGAEQQFSYFDVSTLTSLKLLVVYYVLNSINDCDCFCSKLLLSIIIGFGLLKTIFWQESRIDGFTFKVE